jgi:hypothetical protein
LRVLLPLEVGTVADPLGTGDVHRLTDVETEVLGRHQAGHEFTGVEGHFLVGVESF